MLNPKKSWLSREIVFFILLTGAGAGYLTLAHDSRIVGSLTVMIGVLTLVSIDRVYGTLPLIGQRGLHSAGAVLTGVLFTGVLLASPTVAALTGVGKLFLYLQRKVGCKKARKPTRPGISSFRILFGFLVPVVVWALFGEDALVVVIAAVLLGEFADRLEFYLELEVVTPERQMAIDLQKAILVRRAST